MAQTGELFSAKNNMEKFVTRWSDGKTLPESYVFPPEKRPGQQVIPTSNAIPIVDLGKLDGHDNLNIVEQIIEASQEFGFFQVINHGIDKRLIEDARSIFTQFFYLPDDYKSKFCAADLEPNGVQYYTSSAVGYDEEKVHLWRDALKLSCGSLEESMQSWPQKPEVYRTNVGEYVVKVRELGSTILELICQGLGLEPRYFASALSDDPVLVVNHYPPCPDPSLTLGIANHIDPNLLTILQQGNVMGLQVLKDGEWIGVEPIPDAFVVNIGYLMQIVSSGKLKGVEHRGVTNAEKARTTAAFLIGPKKDCLVKPAEAVVNAADLPMYKGVQYQEFLKIYAQPLAEGRGTSCVMELIKA